MSWLLEFYNMLPSDSRTKSRIFEDEEYAEAVVSNMPEEQVAELSDKQASEDVEVSSEGYSKMNAQLDDLKDSVDLLRHTITVMFGGKKNKKKEFKPTPRPESAVQKALKRRIWEHERAETMEDMAKFGF